MFYTAGQLDGRNIGSTITIRQGESVTYGEIATIEHRGGETEIFLAHGEDALILDAAARVDVVLGPNANYGFFASRALERIEELLKGDTEAFRPSPVRAVS